MLSVVKATPKQGFVKMTMYGPSGRGKTFTSLLYAEGLAKAMKKRVAFIDTERGTDFYCVEVKERKVHPKAFDFDVIHTTSLEDVLTAVKSIDSDTYGVLIIDSISHLWDACQNAVPDDKKTSVGSIPMHMWGTIKRPYKELIRFLMDCPMHTFVLGRQKNIFEEVDGQMNKVAVGLRAEGETEYEFHIGFRMDLKRDRKTNNSTILAIVEKDRTGLLAGRTFANPTFDTIKPVLPLLNGEQAQSQNPDEVAEKDSVLLDQEAEKRKKKGEKSIGLFDEYNTLITKATDLTMLSDAGALIKKNKRYLIDEHHKSLKELYQRKRDKIAEEVAPS